MQGGVIKSEIFFEDGGDTMVHRRTQPTEDLILARNEELRKNPEALRDLGQGTQTWGRMVASIPLNMYEKAIRDGYKLNSRDAQHASDEMFRYLNSEEGKKCMVR